MIALLLSAALGQCGPGGCPAVRPAAVYRASVPTTHVMADESGQRWSHADPTWLATWVARRNAEIRKRAEAATAKARDDEPTPTKPKSVAAWATNGVNLDRFPALGPGQAWYGGNVPETRGAIGATEQAGPDVFLTVIGADADRKPVVESLQKDPEMSALAAAMGERLAVHDYAPDEPMVADVGLPDGGRPDVVIQDATGKVRYRARSDPGPSAIAAEIRKADPKYNPANDPNGSEFQFFKDFFNRAEDQAPILAALAILAAIFVWRTL